MSQSNFHHIVWSEWKAPSLFCTSVQIIDVCQYKVWHIVWLAKVSYVTLTYLRNFFVLSVSYFCLHTVAYSLVEPVGMKGVYCSQFTYKNYNLISVTQTMHIYNIPIPVQSHVTWHHNKSVVVVLHSPPKSHLEKSLADSQCAC